MTSHENINKKRNPFVSAVLTLAVPGLGHVYNGEAKRGIYIYICFLFLGTILLYTFFESLFNAVLSLSILFIIYIIILLHSVFLSLKIKSIRLHKYNKWYYYILIILLVIFIIQPIFKLVAPYDAYRIPSGSMLPTLHIGDHLMMRKYSYGMSLPSFNKAIVTVSKPEFQDVIIFVFPEDRTKMFVQRVIGLPGDTIHLRDKRVFRNGQLLEEPYVQRTDGSTMRQPFPMEKWPPHSFDPRARDNLGPIKVPEEKYFVMGDNRDESFDSRFWGFVDEKEIFGEASYIYWANDKDRIGKEIE